MGNLREGDHLEDRGVDGNIILKWILGKWVWGMDWINLDQDRDRSAVSRESSNETLDYVNCEGFLD